MLGFFRALFRAVLLAGLFVGAAVELVVKRPATRRERAEWLHRFCARSLRVMRFSFVVRGEFPESGTVISNHLSYVDIILFAGIRPCVFAAKADIAKWPVLGWMTTMAGAVYVERGRGRSAVDAAEGMREAYDAGLPVMFFPEGATNNSDVLLPFQSGLLAMALASGRPVTAAHLRYVMPEKLNAGRTVRENVCWGEVPLVGHLWGLLSLRGVSAEVQFAARPIEFVRMEHAGMERKRAAVDARVAVMELGAS